MKETKTPSKRAFAILSLAIIILSIALSLHALSKEEEITARCITHIHYRYLDRPPMAENYVFIRVGTEGCLYGAGLPESN